MPQRKGQNKPHGPPVARGVKVGSAIAHTHSNNINPNRVRIQKERQHGSNLRK